MALRNIGSCSGRGPLQCDGLTIQHLCVLTHLVDRCERYGVVFWALVEEVGHGLATGRGSDWGTHRQHGAGRYDVHSPTHSVCNKKIALVLCDFVYFVIGVCMCGFFTVWMCEAYVILWVGIWWVTAFLDYPD